MLSKEEEQAKELINALLGNYTSIERVAENLYGIECEVSEAIKEKIYEEIFECTECGYWQSNEEISEQSEHDYYCKDCEQ